LDDTRRRFDFAAGHPDRSRPWPEADMNQSNDSTISNRIYFILIAVLTVVAAINIFLPQGPLLAEAQLPASKPIMVLITAPIYLLVYGGLGFIGLKLAHRLGFANLWDAAVSQRQRFLTPALIGIGLGVFFILIDTLFAAWHDLGALPHPPFPMSIVASIAAGIGEEIIFRLFFISFWVWLVSAVLLKGRWQFQIFWIIAILSALAFALAHLPSVMFLVGIESIQAIPPLLIMELVILNGVLSLFAAHYFRLYGFLAAVGIHFWADVVWHIIWGLVA
jgi:membrane protease YdiL (CAAX protease family)